MNALVQIDELCPHCRIPLHMQIGEVQARGGFYMSWVQIRG